MSKKKPAKKKTTKRTSKKSKKQQKRGLLGFFVKWLTVIGLWVGIFVVGIFAWYAQELPDITESASFERKNAIIVKAADGSIVARYGDIIGNQVTTEDMPPHLVQAVLAIEDRRFYMHPGLDPIGLARAMFINAKEGRVAQGGSTITQQLAKNLFLSRERTLKRKIQEAMLAFWLEYELTKDEILSAYLNRVYLGSGTFGVDAAARLYFEKPVEDINLRESATLAGLLKAPSRYSPKSNPSLSKQRTDIVLMAMKDAGYITEEQAKGETKSIPKPMQKPSNELSDRFYADWIVDQLEDLIGTPTEDIIIETTLNPKIQSTITTSINNVIEKHGAERNITEGAFVLMRPNGAVVALVGGKNYGNSQFNRATQALRPPGSAFKPLVYLTALEQGWSPQDLIDDSPITNWRYRPKNFGGKYYGEVTLEEALTYSLNTAAVRLMKEVGPAAVLNTAQRMGITSELQPDLSLALGSSGVSLIEMAGAYAVIANGGRSAKPYGITKITSKETGELYYQRTEKSMKRVFKEHDIQNITSMMNSVMQYGTGRGAAFTPSAAGKTGTSNDSRDALFMGFTRSLVGVAWFGNDDNSPMKGVTGGSYPARVWREVVASANGSYRPVYASDFAPASGFEELLGNIFFGGNNYRNSNTSERRQIFKERVNDTTSLPESHRYNN
jgi:penicillin-binding protein 1A